MCLAYALFLPGDLPYRAGLPNVELWMRSCCILRPFRTPNFFWRTTALCLAVSRRSAQDAQSDNIEYARCPVRPVDQPNQDQTHSFPEPFRMLPRHAAPTQESETGAKLGWMLRGVKLSNPCRLIRSSIYCGTIPGFLNPQPSHGRF